MSVLDLGRRLCLQRWSVFEPTSCCLYFQYCLVERDNRERFTSPSNKITSQRNGVSNISPRRRRPHLHRALSPRNRLLAHNPYHRPDALRRHHRLFPPGSRSSRLPRLDKTPAGQNRQEPRAQFQIHAAHLHDAQGGRQLLLATVQRVLSQ